MTEDALDCVKALNENNKVLSKLVSKRIAVSEKIKELKEEEDTLINAIVALEEPEEIVSKFLGDDVDYDDEFCFTLPDGARITLNEEETEWIFI